MACKYITGPSERERQTSSLSTGRRFQPSRTAWKAARPSLNATRISKVLSYNQNAKGSREGGLEIMTALLAANPKIDGVFAINDPTAIGADLAAKQAQRSEFFIVGVDGSPDAEEALKRENSTICGDACTRSAGDGCQSGRNRL
ncbi:D-ribose transporter subunit RbsB [Citrobacter freundii]|nr:D-ribose transporter subunit RbsB [Citrobacter freundii]